MLDPLDLTDRLYDFHSSDEGLFRTFVGPYPMASLFRYRGLLRKLILDFKVCGHWQSGFLLVDVFGDDELIQEWIAGADSIMAVPSSFWGRWRGKHDLACALAERLSVNSGVPLIKAPRQSYFRFKKQSFLSRAARLSQAKEGHKRLTIEGILELQRGAIHGTNPEDSERPLVVLVDDIVTSARTLENLARTMPHLRFRFLTLATAYRDRLWEDEL